MGETLITGGERGLLGIAFHPDYAENGLFYLHFSANTAVPGTDPGDTVIAEYKVSAGDPDIADPSSQRIVLTARQPDNEQNHKGGSILFGPDKLLFIGLGDGGGGGDNHNPPNGQSVATLLGKMLRIDPLADGSAPYSTPPDNLHQDLPAALPEIWDYGLRNPFRTSFDGCTGDLYIGDVGQGNYEEVDIENVGDGRRNYGWKITEGLHCYASDTCVRNGMTDPLIEYNHSVGTSITGGAVYRGSSIPGLRGAYFYGDYSLNKVWYTFYDRETVAVSTPVSVTQDLNITKLVSISNSSDGELYFISLGSPGAIYRLESAD